MEVKVNALMIRATDYGENDKILTLFSAECGKITAGIKGVKKAGAKLKFAAQPFCFAEYILSQKGGRYTVINASESESFYDLRCDINKFYAASSLCEALSALTIENDAVSELFSLAVKTLSDMCSYSEGFALIKFLVRALTLSGYGFSFGGCAVCGSPLVDKDSVRFDFNAGIFTCRECGGGAGVSQSTYRCLAAASGGYEDPSVTPDGVLRALRLLREYFAVKTDYRLNALSEYLRLLNV
ncbi:MAG: DNA repair protein RecO [Clostridia bacterium]|nr:DNA repair protein RecO [Clostridia bacterium]